MNRIVHIFAALLLSACTLNMQAVREPPYTYAVATAPPWQSMVFAARTDSGVVVVDLGWYGAGRDLRRALGRLGATPTDVTDVFLTHSHRDHIGAWRTVRGARFHLAAGEAPYFLATARHGDFPSRTGEAVLGNPGPREGQVTVRPFASDIVFAFGRDTLRAYVLPGHTPGSAAYLFRRVLFLGDAFSWHLIGGIRPADEIFTENSTQNRANVRALLDRVLPLGVDWACNAHAKCARPDSAFVERITRP